MSQGRPFSLSPPLVGVRGDVAPHEIPPGFLWRSLNTVDRYGRLRTRPGFQAAVSGASLGRIRGGFSFKNVAGVRQTVAAGGAAWWSLISNNQWTDISGSAVFTNGEDDPTRFTVFPTAGVNWLIGVNNVQAPYKWDGVSATIEPLGGSPPIARDATVIGNFVMLGNVIEAGVRAPSGIRVSDFNNLDGWSQYPTRADLTDTNDDIVAVRALTRTIAAIYKEQSIWIAYAQAGLFPFAFETMEYGPGPCSPAAVVRVGQEHYYLATDLRLYRFNGQRSEVRSAAIERYLIAPGLPTQFRSINRSRCWGIFTPEDRRVWFFFPGPNGPDPVLAISHNLDNGASYPHVFPFALTAGWDGDDASSLAWNDLTGTWDHIGPGLYPSWDSFGGTLTRVGFVGSADGQIYRFRYDQDDAGIAIPQQTEFPLKPWFGLENNSHIDGVELFFEQIASGPLVQVDIGVSEALAEPIDPTYVALGRHDTALATRQKFSLSNLDSRFWSIRLTASTSAPLQFLGGMAGGWPEEVPEQAVAVPTQISIPPVVVNVLEGAFTQVMTGTFTLPFMVAVETSWLTQIRVYGKTTTQYTVEFGTPPPSSTETMTCKVIE